MKFKEFDEEIFKRDTNTTDLTNLEIVDETITTLQESYFNKIDGFRRIEKVSLLAIHLLQQENQHLKEKYIAIEKERKTFLEHLDNVEQQRDLYKEVIEEIRKTLKLERKTALSLNQVYTVSVIDSVLQILDKGESNE